VSQINVPVRAYLKEILAIRNTMVSYIVLESDFQQQVINPVQAGEEANEIPPDQQGYPEIVHQVLPNYSVAGIEFYAGGGPFMSYQASASIAITDPQNNTVTYPMVPNDPYTYLLNTPRAIFPQTGQFKLVITVTYGSNTYVTTFANILVKSIAQK